MQVQLGAFRFFFRILSCLCIKQVTVVKYMQPVLDYYNPVEKKRGAIPALTNINMKEAAALRVDIQKSSNIGTSDAYSSLIVNTLKGANQE